VNIQHKLNRRPGKLLNFDNPKYCFFKYFNQKTNSCIEYLNLPSEGTMMALQMAIDATPENKRIGLIHHSHRGLQYCPQGLRKIIEKQLYSY
ncbi:hypothetical protein EZS27_039660, partial [termite gut metagenome]